jgi:hypothetical protein
MLRSSSHPFRFCTFQLLRSADSFWPGERLLFALPWLWYLGLWLVDSEQPGQVKRSDWVDPAGYSIRSLLYQNV